MTKIVKRQTFVDSHRDAPVKVDDLKQDSQLQQAAQQAGTSVDELAKADLNNDGVIAGPDEMRDLFSRMEQPEAPALALGRDRRAAQLGDADERALLSSDEILVEDKNGAATARQAMTSRFAVLADNARSRASSAEGRQEQTRACIDKVQKNTSKIKEFATQIERLKERALTGELHMWEADQQAQAAATQSNGAALEAQQLVDQTLASLQQAKQNGQLPAADAEQLAADAQEVLTQCQQALEQALGHQSLIRALETGESMRSALSSADEQLEATRAELEAARAAPDSQSAEDAFRHTSQRVTNTEFFATKTEQGATQLAELREPILRVLPDEAARVDGLIDESRSIAQATAHKQQQVQQLVDAGEAYLKSFRIDEYNSQITKLGVQILTARTQSQLAAQQAEAALGQVQQRVAAGDAKGAMGPTYQAEKALLSSEDALLAARQQLEDLSSKQRKLKRRDADMTAADKTLAAAQENMQALQASHAQTRSAAEQAGDLLAQARGPSFVSARKLAKGGRASIHSKHDGYHKALTETGIGTYYGDHSPYKNLSAAKRAAWIKEHAKPGTTPPEPKETSCIGWAKDNVRDAFVAAGKEAEWNEVWSEVVRRGNDPKIKPKFRGVKATDLAKVLQERGWQVVFWTKDAHNVNEAQPKDQKYHSDAIRMATRGSRIYHGIKVDDYLMNYLPTEISGDGKQTQQDLTGIDRLRRAPFYFVVTKGGNHTAVGYEGKISENHYKDDPNEFTTVEQKPLREWIWTTGIMVLPPGTWADE